jgi:branched-chain amino acid transport system ATP-binding protein
MTVLMSMQSLTKRFGGLRAVNDISLDIHAGEIVAIFGPNGSGKTTLLNLVSGLLPLTSGSLVWKGDSIERVSAHDRAARGIVKTFQNPLLFDELTVAEHLGIASHLRLKRELGWRRVADLFGQRALTHRIEAGIAGRIEHVLDICRLQHKRGLQAASLSYGDEKMLGVAMGLMCDPDLLLLDEPASGLGQDEVENLDGVLRELKRSGVALCIIDHKVGFLGQLADRALAIANGTRLAEGVPGSRPCLKSRESTPGTARTTCCATCRCAWRRAKWWR